MPGMRVLRGAGTCPSWSAATACWTRAGRRRTSRSWRRRSASRSPCPTCATSWGRTRRGWRSRSRRRVGTTCSWSGRRAPARRCWPSGCPGCCRRWSRAHALEVTAVQSVLGVLPRSGALVSRPPFVAPHHGASMAAIIGGGSGFIPPGRDLPGPPGRAVPRRGTGVQPVGAAGAATAGRVRRGDHRTALLAWCATPPGSSSCSPPTRARAAAGSARGPTAPARRRARRALHGQAVGPLLDRVDLQLAGARGQPGRARPSPRGDERGRGRAGGCVPARCRRERLSGTRWQVNAEVPGPMMRRSVFRLPREATVDLDRAIERGTLHVARLRPGARAGVDRARPGRRPAPRPGRTWAWRSPCGHAPRWRHDVDGAGGMTARAGPAVCRPRSGSPVRRGAGSPSRVT